MGTLACQAVVLSAYVIYSLAAVGSAAHRAASVVWKQTFGTPVRFSPPVMQVAEFGFPRGAL